MTSEFNIYRDSKGYYWSLSVYDKTTQKMDEVASANYYYSTRSNCRDEIQDVIRAIRNAKISPRTLLG